MEPVQIPKDGEWYKVKIVHHKTKSMRETFVNGNIVQTQWDI